MIGYVGTVLMSVFQLNAFPCKRGSRRRLMKIAIYMQACLRCKLAIFPGAVIGAMDFVQARLP
jgi:hypothetical protein